MLIEELASELVELTSSLVGGRTINVMNTDGIIVASTERERIGSYHQGAKEAVQTGRVVNIHHSELSRYSGAKEGCNMPIRVNGTIIGVAGIFGEPETIQDVAHLLEKYTAKYFQLEAMLRPGFSERSIETQLMELLILGTEKNMPAIRALMDRLNLQFRFPVFCVVISDTHGLGLPGQSDALTGYLGKNGFLLKGCDLWGILYGRLTLLVSSIPERSTSPIRELPNHFDTCRVSVGSSCSTIWEIPQSFDEAASLHDYGAEKYSDIRDISSRCRYMLTKTASGEAEFLDSLEKKLFSASKEQEYETLLQSIETYYECSRSVGEAAAKLFVHKNTLQYRVRRVLEILEIEDIPPFWQEYLVRLVIRRVRRSNLMERA